ncbi:MAG: sulfatase [Armatimonadota bacterium]|nr:MAG: sulfatase [Armatimonadota bacterium]
MKRLAILFVFVAVVVSGVWVFHSLRAPTPERFLLIVTDALRADHLGCYGYPEDLTPNIDAFAARSIRFEECWAPSSWTLPSNSALFTGMYRHDVAPPGDGSLPDSATTLAEYFRDSGYATACFAAHPAFAEPYNFQQGFKTFVLNPFEDDRATTASLRWMQQHRDDRFFVLLYLFDPHEPYAPSTVPPALAQRLAAMREPIRKGDVPLRPNTRCPRIVENPSGPDEVSRAEVNALHQLYEAEIRDVDRRIARVLDAIRDDRHAVVAILSDHGEEWLDHGGLEHQRSLYRELLHIPAILRVPGRKAHTVSTPISSIDFAPTFLALAGITPASPLRGHLLLPTRDIQAHPVFAEVDSGTTPRGFRSAVRRNDKVLIHNTGDWSEWTDPPAPTWEAYDLVTDPKQQARLPSRANRAPLLAFERQGQRVAESRQPPELSEADAEKFKSLGYVGP